MWLLEKIRMNPDDASMEKLFEELKQEYQKTKDGIPTKDTTQAKCGPLDFKDPHNGITADDQKLEEKENEKDKEDESSGKIPNTNTNTQITQISQVPRSLSSQPRKNGE